MRTNPRLTTFQQDRNVVAPGSIAIQKYESIAEIDYNLQYILNPGGTGKIPNALVLGLFTGVTF